MSLFGNSQKNQNKSSEKTSSKKKKVKITKSAQQTIPYEEVYPNGMIMLEPGYFSKSYFFGDMNFVTESEEKQEEIIKKYGKLLNKFNHNILFQITIYNRKTTQEKVEEKFFIKPKADGMHEYREEYNQILADRIRDGRNDIQKERYITITVQTSDVIMANNTFNTLDLEISEAIKDINKTGWQPLTTEDRLCILHDIFRMNENEKFQDILKQYRDENDEFSLAKLAKAGMTTKDLIAPCAFVNGDAQIKIGENGFAKTFIITNLPTSLDTSFLSEITNIPCSMLASILFTSLPRKKATKMVKAQSNAIKGEVIKATKQANKEGYDPSLMSEELTTAKEEASFLVKDITISNQKLFFATVTVTIFANTLDELKEFSDIFKMKVSDFMCQVNSLYGQQIPGLKTSLPLGRSYLAIDRSLTTESACAFFPFSVQELMDTKGYFYGLNCITKNMIIYNRRNSPLPNGLFFGKSGSGKSYFAKGEIIPVLLDTEDDVIILDPDGEYVKIAEEFGGTVVRLTQGNNMAGDEPHINPLDMDINYAAKKNEDPVAVKCDYIVSLIESMLGKRDPLSPYEVNVIQKCGMKIYQDYMHHMEKLKAAGSNITCDYEASPTLATFLNELLDMDGPEAHRLVMEIEPYCTGNYSTFAHRTNIDVKTRMLVYDLRSMPKKMKEFSMMVCLSDIWNRVVRNKDEKKATWVYLDEFYLLVQTESSAIMLQEYWKRIRKYFGIMTGITQDIEDVLVTPEGRGILNNSGFVVMMNQSQIGRAELQEQYDISSSLLEYIKDKPPGMGLIYNGRSTVPFNYKLPTDTKLHKLMSTKPDED